MELTGPIVLAVLCGALLHAVWNALIKSGRDKQVDTAFIHSLGVFVALPLLLWTGLPDRAAWPYIAVSTAVHIGYYIALAGADRHGDLGLTYPLMRGSAPLLAALGGAVSIGVVTLGLLRFALQGGDDRARRKPLRFALANAASSSA